MNRRKFIQAIGAGIAGLYVPAQAARQYLEDPKIERVEFQDIGACVGRAFAEREDQIFVNGIRIDSKVTSWRIECW